MEKEICCFIRRIIRNRLRVQGAFVTDKEVSDVVEYIIEKNGQVAYNAEVARESQYARKTVLATAADLPILPMTGMHILPMPESLS